MGEKEGVRKRGREGRREEGSEREREREIERERERERGGDERGMRAEVSLSKRVVSVS